MTVAALGSEHGGLGVVQCASCRARRAPLPQCFGVGAYPGDVHLLTSAWKVRSWATTAHLALCFLYLILNIQQGWVEEALTVSESGISQFTEEGCS